MPRKRRRRSTAVQNSLFLSALIHLGILGALWLSGAHSAPSAPAVMEVYTVSEDELAAAEASALSPSQVGKPLPNNIATLTAEQLAQLPKDPEKLPEYHPSPRARNTITGQIVELADPLHPQVAPDDAEYMSRADHRVDDETASRRYKINSDVLGPTYSEKTSQAHGQDGDAKARLEGDSTLERGDMGSPDGALMASLPPKATEGRSSRPAAPPPSAPLSPKEASGPPHDETPPRVPDTQGTGAAAPSAKSPAAVALLNPGPSGRRRTGRPTPESMRREGAENGASRPIDLFPNVLRYGHGGGGGDDGSSPVQFQQGTYSGAPTNDMIREKPGEATMLNAKEFRYFGYIQKIKRQVNFYWTQALDNITSVRERLTRNEYTTVVHVVLDRQGNLTSVSLVRTCGVRAFDQATLDAFRIAAPFPPPPQGLLDESGRAVLPSVAFTVTLSRGTPEYSAIDPRANVMFPGIAWPR